MVSTMRWPFRVVRLVRHGETHWNREGRRQGQLDSPLTPSGLRHANLLANALAQTDIDALFTSPLGRARETAAVIAFVCGFDPIVVDELSEVDHGLLAGLTEAQIRDAHGAAWRDRGTRKYTWRFPGGESYHDAAHRAALALDTIAEIGAVRPALVTHEMIGRMVLMKLHGLSPADALARSLPHGEVFTVA